MWHNMERKIRQKSSHELYISSNVIIIYDSIFTFLGIGVAVPHTLYSFLNNLQEFILGMFQLDRFERILFLLVEFPRSCHTC